MPGSNSPPERVRDYPRPPRLDRAGRRVRIVFAGETIADTDEALGRLYVLEGSTLGGTFIDRHLATLPDLADGARLCAFSPYGAETGAMWHAFRRVTREHVRDGGDADRLVAAPRTTFTVLADWCEPARRRAPS